jgi:hypothetical protein
MKPMKRTISHNIVDREDLASKRRQPLGALALVEQDAITYTTREPQLTHACSPGRG